MNEVDRIHLGRQSFTIAIDAHKALEKYLKAIKSQAGANAQEVGEEVELRMAELLTERGLGNDKAVLIGDVEFLQEQLGDPKDFHDDDTTSDTNASGSRRLFRDPQNGMIAGVAAGLASYFGIDPLLVRIIFILTVIAGGWGILLYAVLWILIPEAKTSSDRLQMQGKAVTINALKDVVERADVPGAAQRATSTIAPVINGIFRTILKIAGIALITFALAGLFGLSAATIYTSLHHWRLFQENFFPLGSTEHIALAVGIVWLALACLLLIIVGIAMVRRKWPVAAWASGVILGLLFIGLAASIALASDIVPTVRQRVNDSRHSTSQRVPAFTSIDGNGSIPIDIESGSTYRVTITYIGQPALTSIKVHVSANVLYVDSSHFKHRDCTMLCLFPSYDARITVTAPITPNIEGSGSGDYEGYFNDPVKISAPTVPPKPPLH